jgi:hypothetical protein
MFLGSEVIAAQRSHPNASDWTQRHLCRRNSQYLFATPLASDDDRHRV